jgi:hypothetical protein
MLISIPTHTHMCLHTLLRMCTHTLTHACTHAYSHTHTHTHMHTHTQTHTHTHLYILSDICHTYIQWKLPTLVTISFSLQKNTHTKILPTLNMTVSVTSAKMLSREGFQIALTSVFPCVTEFSRRWCTLNDGCFSYYESDKNSSPNGTLKAAEIVCLAVSPPEKHGYVSDGVRVTGSETLTRPRRAVWMKGWIQRGSEQRGGRRITRSKGLPFTPVKPGC